MAGTQPQSAFRDRRLIFRLALSGGLVGILLWRINIGEALETFTDVNYAYVVPALLLHSASKLVASGRWRLMLSRVGRPPLGVLFGTMLIANMTNNVLPLRVGDILRVQVPAQRYGLPRAGLTSTVFITESLVDGVTFVLLALIGFSLLEVPQPLTNLFWALFGAVAAGLVLGLLGAHITLPPGWHERRWSRLVPARVRQVLDTLWPPFVEGMAALRSPFLGGQVLGFSLIAWLLEAASFWLFGLAFELDLQFSSFFLIMIAANMTVSIPVAPAGIGPWELATAEVVAVLGVARPVAGAYAIGTHLFNIMWVGFVGMLAMWALRLGLRDVLYLRSSASPPDEV